jgi:hypothetical protein
MQHVAADCRVLRVRRVAAQEAEPGAGAAMNPFHRLAHDHAFSCALVLLEMVKHLMREECHKDAHTAFYDALMGMLEHYEQQADRQARRLGKPSKN